MNRNILLAALMSLAMNAYAFTFEPLSAGLVAPQINGKDNADPVKGEILYDNTDGNFWGKNATGWTLLGGGSGTGALSTVTKATDYTLTVNDNVVFGDANLGDIVLTLPAASARTGQQVTLKKIDGSAYKVTAIPQSGENIDGGTKFVLSARYQTLNLVSNGTSWSIISFDAADEVKSSNSTIITPAVNNSWHALTGNSVTLGAGTWDVGGMCLLSNSGGSPQYTSTNCMVQGANGSNTISYTAVSAVSGITTLIAPFYMEMNYTTGLGNVFYLTPARAILKCDTSCQIFMNAYSFASTPANSRVSAYINARRVR